VLRPYRIRVYLAANFAAPKMLGALTTNDPLDPAVGRWWKERADEIYRLSPDFGGFVVKANSEGQPGPQDYSRTPRGRREHAGRCRRATWRHRDVARIRVRRGFGPDRVKRAYMEFVPLDGRFGGNVFAQVKNGPLDFQPREPFQSAVRRDAETPLMAELQITQEYLGQANHLVVPSRRCGRSSSRRHVRKGSGVHRRKEIDGFADGKRRTGIAGVANTGRDANMDRPRLSHRPTVRLWPAGLGSRAGRRFDSRTSGSG